MKIYHLCSSSYDGFYYSYLGLGLTEKGADQTFLTLGPAARPDWSGDREDIRFGDLGVSSRLAYPATIPKLARRLQRETVDILHTHLFDAAVVGMAAAMLAKTRIRVVSRHHLDETRLLGNRIHWKLDTWTNRVADRVIVPSEATRRFMIEQEGQTGANVEVIPYGFDFARMTGTDEDRERIRDEFGFSDDIVIGCVGRLFENKGHRYLFEAVGKLVARFPRIKIFVIGHGDRAPLEEVVERSGISSNVVFAGFRRDIPACMKAMDLFVHPSLSESFGQVIVEAMCSGIPVVATTVGGVPEIVSDRETGLLVPPADPDALRSAIETLVADAGLRARMADAGRESVLARFSKERFIERSWQAYQELAALKNVSF